MNIYQFFIPYMGLLGLIFIIFCYSALLSLLLYKKDVHVKSWNISKLLAIISIFVCFLFVPMASFPSYVAGCTSNSLFYIFLFIQFILINPNNKLSLIAKLCAFFSTLITHVVFFVKGSYLGLPGCLFQIDSFSLIPMWAVLSSYTDVFGYLLLAAGVFLNFTLTQSKNSNGYINALELMLLFNIYISFFMPFNVYSLGLSVSALSSFIDILLYLLKSTLLIVLSFYFFNNSSWGLLKNQLNKRPCTLKTHLIALCMLGLGSLLIIKDIF